MRIRHARLRLASVDGVAAREPRKYAQSTSGRMDSQVTSPPDSRSIDMTSDSPSRGRVESALRKYPIVVPQRLANFACSSVDRDPRYVRSSSISQALPMGNILSIPLGHLPVGNSLYPVDMDVQVIRRKRLQQLVQEYGTQTALADKLEIEQNYISRALSGKKRIMEDFATKVELATGKPAGWMSRIEKPAADWPFDFDRRHWDGLPEEERQSLERNFMRMVLGAEAEQNLKKVRRRAG